LRTTNEIIEDMKITATNLDHLSIVAGVSDQLGDSSKADQSKGSV
jgi:hypothetical protein